MRYVNQYTVSLIGNEPFRFAIAESNVSNLQRLDFVTFIKIEHASDYVHSWTRVTS